MEGLKEVLNNFALILAWLVPGFVFLQCFDFFLWKKTRSLDLTSIVNSVICSFIINIFTGMIVQEGGDLDVKKNSCSIVLAVLSSFVIASIYKKYTTHFSLGDNIFRDFLVRNQKKYHFIAEAQLKDNVLVQGQIVNVGVDEDFFLQVQYYRLFQSDSNKQFKLTKDFSSDASGATLFIKGEDINSMRIRMLPKKKNRKRC